MKKSNLYIITLAGVLGAAGVTIFAPKITAADGPMPSCCGNMPSGCGGMADMGSAKSALMEPVKSVYDHYLAMQAGLASDSLTGVADNADAIAKAVRGDAMKMLPEATATQAEALAQATDLGAARAAFKPLSDTLIKYLADHQIKDAYVRVYCPMARASWLQKDNSVNNPYMGKSMSGCGEIQ
jgi:Cu(I)/Ag(I) efflux system membrane fusion protein